MADINIVQEHALAPDEARAAADKMAQKLAAQFDLECVWDGDVLRFGRGAINGSLTLRPQQAEIHIALGFPYSALASAIEGKVAESMRKVFGGP